MKIPQFIIGLITGIFLSAIILWFTEPNKKTTIGIWVNPEIKQQEFFNTQVIYSDSSIIVLKKIK